MTDHSNPREIEEGLQRDRARLTATLDELQDRVSVENLAKEALGMIRSNASAYTSSLDQAVRANPMALAVTAVGLAWLIFGSRKPAADSTDRWDARGSHGQRDGFGGDRRSEGARVPGGASGAEYGASPGAGAGPGPGFGAGHGDRDDDDSWSDRIDALRRDASRSLRRIEDDARSRVGDVRDLAADRARVVADLTGDMRAAFRHGLDDLSEAARERVARARQTAYQARLKMSQAAASGSQAAGRMIEEHPLVAGAIAMALGAALAAALPRTRVEDRTFGAESDRLMARAAAILREERARVARVSEGVAEELKGSARDVVDAAAEKAGEVYEKVRSRVAEEAGSGEAAASQDRTPGGEGASGAGGSVGGPAKGGGSTQV